MFKSECNEGPGGEAPVNASASNRPKPSAPPAPSTNNNSKGPNTGAEAAVRAFRGSLQPSAPPANNPAANTGKPNKGIRNTSGSTQQNEDLTAPPPPPPVPAPAKGGRRRTRKTRNYRKGKKHNKRR